MAYDVTKPNAANNWSADLTAMAANFEQLLLYVLGKVLLNGVTQTLNWDAGNSRYSGVTLSGSAGITGGAAYTYNGDGTIDKIVWSGGSFGSQILTRQYNYSSGRVSSIDDTIT